MKNALTLTEKETFFIKENRQDPVTGDEFSIGDEIVFCASCKSAFLKESWEYMNSRHCGQIFTLKRFPVQSKLTLSKSIVDSFKKADNNIRILAYMLDALIAVFLAILFYFLFEIEDSIFFIIVNLYMLLRDILGKKSSIGKRIVGLYFINTKTQENASPFILLFRNVFYWICLLFNISFIYILEIITGNTGGLVCIIALLVANIIHVTFVFAKQNNIFDRMLRIELVEKKK